MTATLANVFSFSSCHVAGEKMGKRTRPHALLNTITRRPKIYGTGAFAGSALGSAGDSSAGLFKRLKDSIVPRNINIGLAP